MLSPGKYHLDVPKDLAGNLAYRARLMREAGKDRNTQRGIWHLCRQDILFYVNLFIWQFNPNRKGFEVGPFISWDFQDEVFLSLLWHIENDEDVLIEKSREMGASWMILIVFEWLWHFHDWKTFNLISRSEKAVEDDNPDSLFWKLDFIHRYQPGWMSPKQYRRRKMYFGNDDLKSHIYGEASTGKAGVGGRCTAMGIDEYSQIKEDFEVLHRTSDTTGCRIFNGTHKGLDTAFYQLSQRVDMHKIVMHWSQHPEKKKGLYRYDREKGVVEIIDKTFRFPTDYKFVTDGSPTGGPYPGIRSPWYDKACRRKGDSRAVAMDLDIDPKGSVSQVFNALTIYKLKEECHAPFWQGSIEWNKDTGEVKEMVKGAGALRLWCNLDGRGRPPQGQYAAGVDCATGLGATPSCLSVLNVDRGEKVLEYADSQIDPKDFASMCVSLCRMFSDAKLAWEVPGPGLVFAKEVLRLNYTNYHRNSPVNTSFKGPSWDGEPGWRATPNSKMLLINQYKKALEERRFINWSEIALDECLAFKYTTNGGIEHSGEKSPNDPRGARLNHGDQAIADALAWMCGQTICLAMDREEENKEPVLSMAWRRKLKKKEVTPDGIWLE